MPSVALQRKKLASCYDQEISIIQQVDPVTVEGKVECMKLLQAPVKGSSSLSPENLGSSPSESVARTTQAGMNYTSNPNLSQGHPIDELGSEPVDTSVRTNQHLLVDSNHSSSDFGPFVSGFPDEFRQRSSSFNTSISRAQSRPSYPGGAVVGSLKRFSDTCTRSGSVDSVTAFNPQHGQLRHSNTVPEIPAYALSNDSGYHTPPNRQHGQTSPGVPGRTVQWPIHVSPPVASTTQYSYQNGPPLPTNRTSAPLPLNQNLTIETSGHYQPEPNTPQIVIGQPIVYSHPMPIFSTPGSYPRSHDPPSSLQSQGSTPQTPEEGVCSYQRDRKNRLVNAFQGEEAELAQLKTEEEQLRTLIEREGASNSGFDISATEKEVQSMTTENKKLALDIQRLTQRLPIPAPPSRPLAPPAPGYPSNPGGAPPAGHYPLAMPRPPPVIVLPRPLTYPDMSTPNPLTPAAGNHQMINNPMPTTIAQRRPPPPAPPPRTTQPNSDEMLEQWSCVSCTLLNHPLIFSCEVCDTPRPRPGNTTPTNAAALVKKSLCQHQSGCFCHAHLS